jgi:hypothetical protein
MDLVISILIVIAVQFGSFVILRSRIQRELNATSLLKDVQDEVDGMVRELNLSAERNIALLEARIEELESLLSQSDQKLVLLAKELDRRERSTEVYTQLKKPQITIAEEPASEPEPVAVAETAFRSEPVPAVAAPSPTPAQPAAVSAAEPQLAFEDEPTPAPRTLTERVLGFRDQGLDTGAIAGATGATRGEVELILSLHPIISTR